MAHEDDGWVAPAGFNFTRDVVEHFATDPRRTALTFVDGDGVIERRTFAQVAADAARWAHLLRGSGYQPGDRVLALLGNVPETTGILLGAIKCGLVVVPCPEPMAAHDLAFRARQTGASVLIADRSAEIDVDDACAELETEIDVLFLDEAEALLKRCRPVAPTEITSADHYPFILYTSGVTKAPKGVAHTHAATHAVRLQAKHWLDVGPGDIVWCSAGNWWGHSIWNVLGPWSFGAEIVMHAGGFDPAERLDLLEFLGVSILGQTAREYGLMAELDHLETSRPSRLRHAVSAGEPLRPAVIARFHEAFGIAVHNGYGQAENALLLAGTPSSASQLGSMGLPIRGHHLAVIDEDGREMPLGEEGEIGLAGAPADAVRPLLGRTRGDRGRVSGALVPHGRPGHTRRRRQFLVHGARRRRDRQRRPPRRCLRGGERVARPSGGCRERRGGQARRRPYPDREGVRRSPSRTSRRRTSSQTSSARLRAATLPRTRTRARSSSSQSCRGRRTGRSVVSNCVGSSSSEPVSPSRLRPKRRVPS